MKHFALLFLAVSLVTSALTADAQYGNAFTSSGGSVDDPPVTVGGGWLNFTWQNGPNAFDDQGAYTFTSSSTTLLTITDLGVDGDRFSVFNHGILVGTTSVPLNDGYDNESLTDNQALADSHYSHGFFNIGPGANSITIETIQIATGYPFGGAALRVDAVPEPGTTTLIGIGVVSLLAGLRRKS